MIVAVVPLHSPDDVSKALEALSTPLVEAVELRLDYIGGGVQEMLDALRRAAELGILERSIVTVRAAWEEGAARLPDEERLGVLKAALDHGAMLVDLEALTLERVEPSALEGLDWSRVLLSVHTAIEQYSDGLVEHLYGLVRAHGAWGAKLAVRADSPERASQILYWALSEARRLGVRAAVMPYGCCMGLRLALYASGSEILYVCARRSIGGTAEGQPCLEEDTHRSLVECASRLRATLRS